MADDKLSQIIDDIEAQQERTGSSSEVVGRELRTELSMNVWPLLRALAIEVKQRIDSHDEAFAELARREESFIQPELAGDILGALEVGRQIAVSLVKILKEGSLPEGEDRDQLIQQVAAYVESIPQLADEISSVAVDLEDPGDYDEYEDDGSEEGSAERSPLPFSYEVDRDEGDEGASEGDESEDDAEAGDDEEDPDENR